MARPYSTVQILQSCCDVVGVVVVCWQRLELLQEPAAAVELRNDADSGTTLSILQTGNRHGKRQHAPWNLEGSGPCRSGAV